MKRWKKTILAAAILPLLAAQVGCQKGLETVGNDGKSGVIGALEQYQQADWENLPDPYSEGQVVAWLDSTPVTLQELERFYIRVLGGKGGPHGARTDPVYNALPVFRRYHAVNQEAQKLGLHEKPLFRQRFDLTVRTSLAGIFTRWLVDNAQVDSGSIKARIPSRWLRMNFAVKVFPDEKQAAEARARMKGPEDFHAARGGVGPSGRDVPQTGLVFPGSGFFGPWEDSELFQLEEKDIHGPIQTGIGIALVLVLERHDMTPEDQASFMEEARKELANQWATAQWEQFVAGMNIEVRDDVLEKAIFEEFTGGMFVEDTVAVVGDDEISFRLFRLMSAKSYSSMQRKLPMAAWKDGVRSDLTVMLRQIAVGRMAQESYQAGQWPGEVSDGVLRTLYDYRKTFLYYSYLDLVDREARKSVSEGELLLYYQKNRGLFAVPGSVDIIYKLVVDEKTPATWRTILSGGGSFGDAANATSGPKSPHGADGKMYSQVTIYNGDTYFKDMQEAFFAMEAGDTAVLKGEMGTYLVHVDAKSEGRELTFEESREEVQVRLVRQRISDVIDKKVDELAAPVKVKISEEYVPMQPGDLPPAQPQEDIPNADMG